MANEIPATTTVSIPQYVADGISGSGSTRTLTFSGGAPPTDGSVALAFILLSGLIGFSWDQMGFQRLAYWRDATVGVAKVVGCSGFDFVSVPTWSFVADANID